jgi:hypothetical protein
MPRIEELSKTHVVISDLLNIFVCIVLYVALASVIRNLETRGNITTKLKQINAYADDIVITARTKKDLIKTFELLER